MAVPVAAAVCKIVMKPLEHILVQVDLSSTGEREIKARMQTKNLIMHHFEVRDYFSTV